MTTVTMTYHVGDTVEWVSQSQAYRLVKRGTIVAVVPAGERPGGRDEPYGTPILLRGFGLVPEDYNLSKLGGGYGRKGASVLVAVPTPSGRGRPKLYWPHLDNLEVVSTDAGK